MPFDDYSQYRRFNQDVSVTLTFAAAATTSTLITARDANHTVFIQKIAVYIETDAAQSLKIQDSASTPIQFALVAASPGAGYTKNWDFGPAGIGATVGKNITATFSAAGLAGHLEITAYTKRTVVGAP